MACSRRATSYGITPYTYADGHGTTHATINGARHLKAQLRRIHDDGDPTWVVRFSSGTPPAVQRIVLHAVLNADGDETTLLHMIAAAWPCPSTVSSST
ncbi:hypothetical protein OHA72_10115 [Dactylosporangium sp. NBC_01737]|uniref:hypothetical protein n=1 Tax=Dactylosporangium sp. NBC_01737 TaxID=2975959 RepID=UPI002E1267A6|nr:hypothetical protein OHA72_10115 [Dactylosporangium sp. NBC_01737]